MAFSVNEVHLVGNITKEPELRYTANGKPICNFSVATNRSIKQQDGSFKDYATFHKVVVWGKIAEWLSQNINKGQKVYVDGRIDNRSYDAQDGTKKYISEIVASNVIPMSVPGGAKKTQAAAAPKPPEEDDHIPPDAEPPSDDPSQEVKPDDIPF